MGTPHNNQLSMIESHNNQLIVQNDSPHNNLQVVHVSVLSPFLSLKVCSQVR